MKRFLIEYKNGIYYTKARSKREAFAKFFLAVQNGKIKLDDVGQIIILKYGKYECPFRTVPSLWLLKVIDQETALINIQLTVGCSKKEALELLFETAHKDSWILEEVEKIKHSKEAGS